MKTLYYFSFFVLLGLNNFSYSQDDAFLWSKESFNNLNPDAEIIEKRSEFAKHFTNENGKITAVITAGPMHYMENGKWNTIYHSIIPQDNGFQNLTNKHKTIYPKTSAGTIVTTFENGEVLVEMLGMRMYFQGNNEELTAKTIQNQQGKVDFDELIYQNSYGNGIDLKIKHGTVGRKMDYIIQNKVALGTIPPTADFLVFEEIIELPSGWKASINGNKIELKDASGKVVANYEEPRFTDTDTHIDRDGESVEDHKHHVNEIVGNYEIKQNGNSLKIKTLVPTSWLNSDLNFPIYIDPTITLYPDNTERWTGHHRTNSNNSSDCYTSTCSQYTTTNIDESVSGTFWLGRYNTQYVYQGWSKFNITDIPDDACISSAIFRYNVQSNNSASSGCVIQTRFRQMAADPSLNVFDGNGTTGNPNNQARLTDIRDGDIFNESNTAVLVSGTGWRNVNLTANLNHLQTQLVPNWFAVGLQTYFGGSNHLTCRNEIMGYTTANRPQLVVDYNPPTAEDNITICPEDLPYDWHGQTINAGGTAVATRITTGTNGCDLEVTLNLTVHPTTPNQTNDITICDSELPYTWNGQTINAGGTAVATHTTQNSNGCDVITVLNLTVNPSTHLTDNITICSSELPYSWNGQTINAGGTAVATHNTAGTNGCPQITTLNLTVNTPTNLTDNVSVCSYELPYSWNGQTINAGGNGVATHTTQDANGCDVVTTLNLTVNTPITPSFSAQAELCLPAEVQLTQLSNGQGNCVWTINGNTAIGDCSGVFATVSQAGCYDVSLTITDANGCTSSTTENDAFCIMDSPIADFSLTQNGSEGVTTNVSEHADSYVWTLPNGTSSEFEPVVPFGNISGSYTITLHAYNNNGCVDSSTVTIDVVFPIAVPNVITANNDGVNDFFVIEYLLPNSQLIILNRWGNVIYQTENYDNLWNGRTMGGNLVSEGVYNYVLTTPNGEKQHGFVHVVH